VVGVVVVVVVVFGRFQVLDQLGSLRAPEKEKKIKLHFFFFFSVLVFCASVNRVWGLLEDEGGGVMVGKGLEIGQR
jgi:hypothetical protein